MQRRSVGDAGVEITDLAYDSRKVGPGTLFFCVPGEKADGHDFAPAAVEAGAAALVVERELELDVAAGRSSPTRARRWRRWRRASRAIRPRELRVVGITGTNGKTTTAFLSARSSRRRRSSCGLLGTVKQVVGGVEEEVERTTPEAIDLQADLPPHARRRRRGLRDGGLLARARRCTAPTRSDFEVAAVHQPDPGPPRLPRRHGGLLPGQAQAVRRPGPGTAIVNVDDPYGAAPGGGIRVRHLLGRGRRRRLTRPATSASTRPGATLHGDRPEGDRRCGPRLPGHFNVANALGAFAAARALGSRPPTSAAAGLARARAGAGPLRADRRGPGLRRPGRLRAHAGLARERAAAPPAG